MKYKIIITEPAESDIASAVHYIAHELRNRSAAIKLLNDLESSIASLSESPERYPLVRNDHLASNGFRFLPIHKYLAFYIVREETRTVTVERFLHSRRDWGSII